MSRLLLIDYVRYILKWKIFNNIFSKYKLKLIRHLLKDIALAVYKGSSNLLAFFLNVALKFEY